MKHAFQLNQVRQKAPCPEQTLKLVAGQRLAVSAESETNDIEIIDSRGRVKLAIRVTAQGPRIRLTGAPLTIEVEGEVTLEGEQVAVRGRRGLALDSGGDLDIRAAGKLALEAESVAVNGREEMVHTSGGDMALQAQGRLHSEARAQTITAQLANVDIKANDDVTLDGERIRMNC